MPPTVTVPETLIDRYIATWNEIDPGQRRALIEQVWAAGGHYKDPLLEATGHEGIDTMTAGFQQSYPGYRFERTPDSASGNRFGWKLVAPNSTTFVEGEDSCELDASGRFTTILGTFNQ